MPKPLLNVGAVEVVAPKPVKPILGLNVFCWPNDPAPNPAPVGTKDWPAVVP